MHYSTLLLALAATPLVSARFEKQPSHAALAKGDQSTDLHIAAIVAEALTGNPIHKQLIQVVSNASRTAPAANAMRLQSVPEAKAIQDKKDRKAKAAREKAAADAAAAQKAAEDKKAADAAAAAAASAPAEQAPQPAAQPAPEADRVTVAAVKKPDAPQPFQKGRGLMNFVSTNCGPSNADENNPNGSEDFLTCGISRSNPGAGWSPPNAKLSDLSFVSIEEAMSKNSVWAPCGQYISTFEKYGNEMGIPPIMLASFALQESTCNAGVRGDNGGSIGLMQITKDKCGGRSLEACHDPDFNIRTGAAYFKSELDRAGGNVFQALGQYNGWNPGMSFQSATAAQWSECCRCQNNLDYLFQMVNGWMQGKSGYSMGKFQNLKTCSQ